jgi:hypothetical protein
VSVEPTEARAFRRPPGALERHRQRTTRCSVGSVRSSSKYHFSSDDMAVQRVFELLANHPLERAVRVRERARKHQAQRPSGKGPTAYRGGPRRLESRPAPSGSRGREITTATRMDADGEPVEKRFVTGCRTGFHRQMRERLDPRREGSAQRSRCSLRGRSPSLSSRTQVRLRESRARASWASGRSRNLNTPRG